MLTKKTFLAAAKIIAEYPSAKERAIVAGAFITLFHRDNPRFDSARFLTACNVDFTPAKDCL